MIVNRSVIKVVVVKMMKKEKPMMSVTAIIQGAQQQHWSRSFGGFVTPQMSLGNF